MPRYIIRNLARNAYWSLKDSAWILTTDKDEARRFENRMETRIFLQDQSDEHDVELVK
jgi:hypothetical protein